MPTAIASTIIPYDRALPEIPDRSPYTCPDAYLEKRGAGDYRIVKERRPSSMFLVEKLRQTVNAWRKQNYPGLSDVTRRLFQFWFEDDHLLPDGTFWRYWWAQRESVETLIYLTEVCGYADFAPLAQAYGETPELGMLTLPFNIETNRDGQRLLRRWVPELEKESAVDLPETNLLRYAFKMATGTGKTVVMAMLITWSLLNRRLNPQAARAKGGLYADNFLIVAPNVIVYERLKKDFASNRIFNELPLVPPEYKDESGLKVILRGDSAQPDRGGNLFLVNIHQIYESRDEEWDPANAIDAILGRPPKQDLASYQSSMLERIKSLDNLMALNDEAHHVHDDDLSWNQTLLALQNSLKEKTGHGLSLWLDFSATPKTQAGTYFPWVISDYPLAQAIEDQIVKAPLIIHTTVKRKDLPLVTKENVARVYNDWIAVALDRWNEHSRVYGEVGQKPVLFIMAERTTYADVIAEHVRHATGLSEKEVLVIHTDTNGNLTKGRLEEARDAARDVDNPKSAVKIIVSVLMLREGWDVRNVTVILGLRPFTATAEILPEQAVGRGLRPMTGISPDRRQTLEVIGTEAFENFVQELEHEGVGIDTVSEPPPMPIKIYPIKERARYDVAIPLTRPRYTHAYRNLKDLDPYKLKPIYQAGVLAEEVAIEIEMTFATTGTTVSAGIVHPGQTQLSQDFMRDMTQLIERQLGLEGRFAELYRLVKHYVQHRCFGVEVDLDGEDIMKRMRDPLLQDGIVAFLSREIAQLSVQKVDIEFENAEFRLSETQAFMWKRQHLACKHTIFNECAVYNNLEARFAQFLDAAPDVARFAALAETFTRFRVDYLSATGAIKFYYPDFVAVQKTTKGEVNWICETKGQEREDVPYKDASIEEWCRKISAQTGQDWRYLKIPQSKFETFHGNSLELLTQHLAGATNTPSMFVRSS